MPMRKATQYNAVLCTCTIDLCIQDNVGNKLDYGRNVCDDVCQHASLRRNECYSRNHIPRMTAMQAHCITH